MAKPKSTHPWYGARGAGGKRGRKSTASKIAAELLDREIERQQALESTSVEAEDLEEIIASVSSGRGVQHIEGGIWRVPVRYDGE